MYYNDLYQKYNVIKSVNDVDIKDVTPFDPLVLKVHYDGFDWKKLEPVCEEIMKSVKMQVHLETGDAKSSAPNQQTPPHKRKEFADFYKFIEPISQKILKKYWGFFENGRYAISNSWINYHGKGGATAIHHHGPAALTMAAYLNLPKDGGYIQFKDPLEYHKGHFLKNIDEELYDWKTLKAETGDVIIFPGWIRHRTEPNKSDEKRWVLTTNYMTAVNI